MKKLDRATNLSQNLQDLKKVKMNNTVNLIEDTNQLKKLNFNTNVVTVKKSFGGRYI